MAQIGVDLGNYTFDASAKTITFSGVVITSIEQIKPIVNGTRQTVIFNPADSGKFGSLSGNILTLDFDTTTYSDSDKLYICVNNEKKQDFGIDAFGRQRVSEAQPIFEGQLTYGLQPLIYEQITNGSGAAIAHDSTNRNADLSFTSSTSGADAIMQTFEHFRYQAGKSQLIYLSFNMKESVAGVTKFAGYSDGSNGIEFITSGGTNSIRLLSDTAEGDTTVAQSSWNLNTYSDLDISKVQLMVIDFQALYVGVVRVGFEIGNSVIYVHEFTHANSDTEPYIQTANLPIRCGMTVDSGTATTSMNYICSSVSSEGGIPLPIGVPVAVFVDEKQAGNNDRDHLVSIRPRTLFNGFTNRVKIAYVEFTITVNGNNPVRWELCIGQDFNDALVWNNVNTEHSSIEYSVTETEAAGSPTLIIDTDTIGSAKDLRLSMTRNIDIRVPITLDSAGLQRSNGTLSLVVTGVDGNSNCYGKMKWIEIY